MSSELAVEIVGLGKRYRIYDHPRDRLREGLCHVAARALPPLGRYFGERAAVCGRDFWAVQEATLSIRQGETIGIVGRNGSGKSTLLQLICGTLFPTTGSILCRGRIAALLELGAGFNPEFTGRENVLLNAQLLGLTRRQALERFDAIAEFAEIGRFIDQPVKSYSSGMFVRLAFAVIAHVDADILVVDEALAVGDAYFTQKCMRFLYRFMAHGTVLFVSHDIAAVKALAERSVWLENGRVRMIGSTREIADRYLEALYAENQAIGGSFESATPASSDWTASINSDAVAVDNRSMVTPVLDEDFRLDQLAELGLENRLLASRFDPTSAGFGDGRARVAEVKLIGPSGKSVVGSRGGERVTLEIQVDVVEEIGSPILGFFLRNRLGQNVFGDNSFLATRDAPLQCPTGSRLKGSFAFVMPFLPQGDYAFSVAVASGSNSQHVQHQWLHDALMIKSTDSLVHADVFGMPMASISVEIEAASERMS